jgi:hypothetical protein
MSSKEVLVFGRVVILVYLIYLSIAGAGCASPPRPAVPATEPIETAVRAEVMEELTRYYADFSARRWNAFATHFWPGATITTIWQAPGESGDRVVITSIDRFIELAPQGPDSKAIFEERMTGADMRVHGDLAHVWAKYNAKFGDPGDIKQWSGIDAFTLMKHDGRWKIVALAFAGE